MRQRSAFKFLVDRWQFMHEHVNNKNHFISLLIEFQRKHGEEAVQDLAGYYIYVTKNNPLHNLTKERQRALINYIDYDLIRAEVGQRQTASYYVTWIQYTQYTTQKETNLN